MKEKINQGHYLELMDRLHVIAENVDTHCLQHPVAQANVNLQLILEHALDQLMEAYQLIGDMDSKQNG